LAGFSERDKVLVGRDPSGLRMHEIREIDLQMLTKLESLAWLSVSELKTLIEALEIVEVGESQILRSDGEFREKVQILLRGAMRLVCKMPGGDKVTIALFGPGPLPSIPSLAAFPVRCEAYRDSKVGMLSWKNLTDILGHRSESAFENLYRNDLERYYLLLLRSSHALNLDLHERTAVTMLELASNFGIKESRGIFVLESFSQSEIAELIGASRSRVTENLVRLEKEGLIIRQARRYIVNADGIRKLIRRPLKKSRRRILGLR
jgi:DNA-binding MarR family transcriptional regulator